VSPTCARCGRRFHLRWKEYQRLRGERISLICDDCSGALLARNEANWRGEQERLGRVADEVETWLAAAPFWSVDELERARADHLRVVNELRSREAADTRSPGDKVDDYMVLLHARRPWADTLPAEQLAPLIVKLVDPRGMELSWPVDPPKLGPRDIIWVRLVEGSYVPMAYSDVLRHEISSHGHAHVNRTTSLGSVYRDDQGAMVVLWVYEQTTAVSERPFAPTRTYRLD
jgi:hypothetical protein